MEVLIVGLWILFFFTIPVAVILVAGNVYGKYKTVEIVGKLLISIFIYIVTTIISFLFSILVVVGAEPRNGKPLTVTEQVIGLSAVYIYGFVGYLLCSFINGGFFKPWKFSVFYSKKPQTIFGKK